MRDNPTGGPAKKKGWSDEERDAYNAALAEGMTQTSRPVAGVNTGNRPLGLNKALADAKSEQGRDKRTSARYRPMTPTFTPPQEGTSFIDNALDVITRDDAALARENRQVNAAMGLPFLSGESASDQMPIANAVKDATVKASQIMYQPALAALQGWDYAWENVIAEPLATTVLATNKNNPVFKDGFQPGDMWGMWTAARDAANDASWGTAAMSNQFFLAAASSPLTRNMPGIAQMFGLANMLSPILEKVNPFDPDSIQEARDNYIAYNAITGATDFGLNFLPIPMGKGVSAVRRLTGLSNKVREADRAVIASDWELYKQWFTSNGADGYETNIGKQIMEIANSGDRGFILTRPIVKNQSGAARGKLSDLYAKTEDPEAVFDIFQASIGDTQAIQRLLDSGNADLAYSIGNVNEGIAGIVAGGGKYVPDGNALHYYDQATRDAIQRTEWSRSVYKTFIDEGLDENKQLQKSFTVLGDWAPMGGQGRILPSIARPVAGALEDARIAKADINAALATGKEEYLPAVAEKIIQTTKDGPVIRLLSIRPGALQWSFAYRPLNIVSFSGSRPDDVIEEAYAVMNQIEGLRFGQEIPVGTEVLQDGTIRIVKMSAEEFRERAITRITDAMSKEGDAVAQAFREMENDIVRGMAYSNELSKAEADKIVEGIRDKADTTFDGLQRNGYFIDDRNGMKVEVNPQTRRQLRDAYYTMPLNEIEAAFKSEAHHILRRPAQVVGDGARDVFEFGSTLFRTNMLVKPGYTFRNSILEPMVTTMIAHLPLLMSADGAEMFMRGVYNFGRNNVRRAARMTVGVKDLALSSRLTAKQRKLVNEYVSTMHARDDLADEIARKNIMESPQAQAEMAEIQDELNVINHMLDLTVRDLVAEGIATPAIALRAPSLHRLTTEIDAMSSVAKDPMGARAVEEATDKALYHAGRGDEDLFEYWSARAELLKTIEAMPQGERDDLLISLKTMRNQLRAAAKRRPVEDVTGHHNRVALLTQKLDDMQDQLLEVRGAHAIVKARRERRATPYLQGEGKRTKPLENGQTITVDEAFAGPYGSAVRADSSSAMTNVQAMDPSAHNTTMMNMVFSRFRRGRTGSVSVNDPNYFEEVHYIAARHFAGDALFDMIATKSKADVQKWAKTKEGLDYFKDLGVNGKKYMKDIDEAYYVYNKLFPTKEAQELIASGREFTTGELQSALLKRGPDGEMPKLADVVGQEIDYIVPSSSFHQAGSLYRKALDRLWDYIATQPETRLARWPYYIRQFDQELTERMNVLARQGVHIDLAVANAQRRASHVATLSNLERTFYNIRRYRNPVFTARFVMAFPGAFANSIARYAYYLPKTHTANMMTLMNVTNSAFNALSVDENGDHTGLANAKYLLLPGTGKPPKDGMLQDAGVRIPIDAATRIFLDNPGRSWLTAVSVDSLLNLRPSTDKWMKEYFPQYLTAFLQNAEPPKEGSTEWQGGPQKGDVIGVLTGSLFANWQKTLVNWWQGTGSEKYLQDWGFAWQNVQAEKLRRGDTSPVTREEVEAVVDGWTGLRALVQFASPTSYQVDAPGQLERDTWFRLQDQYPGLSFEDLRQKYYQILGGDADDPITAAKRGEWGLPYTMSTSRDPYGMNNQYTVESLEAVERHKGLAEVLGSVDPELVGLLAVGSGGSYSRAVYNNMAFETPYDSAREPYRSKKMPQEYLTDWEVQEGWAEWSESKARYVEGRKMAVASGDRAWVEAIDDSWDFYRYNDDPSKGELGIEIRRPEWAIKKSMGKVDEVNAVATALGQLKADPAFMADRGNDEDWQSVWTMLDRRAEIEEKVRSLGSSDEDDAYKKQMKEYFIDFYNEESLKNPLLMDLWDRYFASEWETE